MLPRELLGDAALDLEVLVEGDRREPVTTGAWQQTGRSRRGAREILDVASVHGKGGAV